jgi:hypothetical protein
MISQIDGGIYTVLHEFEYKNILNTLLESDVYQPLSKEPIDEVQLTVDS